MFVLFAAMLLGQGAQAADVDNGKALYTAKCQAWHGAAGQGDGPAARALPKKPADMSAADFWSSRTEDQVIATIRSGKPGSAMRGFPMDDAKAADLVAYLKSFKKE